MSERGVFAVDRGIWSDPDFADGEFSEREAFIWLVGQAAWKPMRIRVGSGTVDLARGQCAFSTRFLAEKWSWSEARVRRYLGRLISREIICASADKKSTHITILKYDRFQRVSLPESDVPTQTRRTSDAPTTHQRRKEEDIKGTELIQEISSLRSESARPAPSPRRTKIKPTWVLGEDEVSAARKAGVDPVRAAVIWPQFVDYHAGKGTIMADWLAAWRTWCRNDTKFSARGVRQRSGSGGSTADFWAGQAIEGDEALNGGRYDNRPFNRDADPWDRSGEPGGRRSDKQVAQQAGADPWGVATLRLVGGGRA